MAADLSTYVAGIPELVLFPPTLADFECEHGELAGCTACAAADREAELDLEADLAGWSR